MAEPIEMMPFWDMDSGVPKEPCVRRGYRLLHMKG